MDLRSWTDASPGTLTPAVTYAVMRLDAEDPPADRWGLVRNWRPIVETSGYKRAASWV